MTNDFKQEGGAPTGLSAHLICIYKDCPDFSRLTTHAACGEEYINVTFQWPNRLAVYSYVCDTQEHFMHLFHVGGPTIKHSIPGLVKFANTNWFMTQGNQTFTAFDWKMEQVAQAPRDSCIRMPGHFSFCQGWKRDIFNSEPSGNPLAPMSFKHTCPVPDCQLDWSNL